VSYGNFFVDILYFKAENVCFILVENYTFAEPLKAEISIRFFTIKRIKPCCQDSY
jgi:hypothetical protein